MCTLLQQLCNFFIPLAMEDTKTFTLSTQNMFNFTYYKGRSESKERFAIQRYLLIIEKKQNMQVLSHTFTYFST